MKTYAVELMDVSITAHVVADSPDRAVELAWGDAVDHAGESVDYQSDSIGYVGDGDPETGKVYDPETGKIYAGLTTV